MNRRDFLRLSAVAAGSAVVHPQGMLSLAKRDDSNPQGSLLETASSDSPIDTVVVVMLENRSVDHYLGWLGTDERYRERGRRRYGRRFHVDGRVDVSYLNLEGHEVTAAPLVSNPKFPNPWRGCGHPVPGHGWFAGREQLTKGFLAPRTGNDEYAIGYYRGEDLPFYAKLANRFTICDHHFASLMGPTFPNRQYLHSAQSGGERDDPIPIRSAQWNTETIEDRLLEKHVSVGYFYVDLPILLLWGERFKRVIAPVDTFFERCDEGRLPRVSFIDPGFGGDLRTDEHSYGDIRLGQRFVREIFKAFVNSKHWKSGLFILTYDEWGGFFDHVRPPLLPDDRAVPDIEFSFGLAGFRVPSFIASPYAARNFADHRIYDHTSILRFLEWRFLGAPAEGPGGKKARWFLTKRDRSALNIGASLGNSNPNPDVEGLFELPHFSSTPACAPENVPHPVQPPDGHDNPFQFHESLEELLLSDYPKARHRSWEELAGV